MTSQSTATRMLARSSARRHAAKSKSTPKNPRSNMRGRAYTRGRSVAPNHSHGHNKLFDEQLREGEKGRGRLFERANSLCKRRTRSCFFGRVGDLTGAGRRRLPGTPVFQSALRCRVRRKFHCGLGHPEVMFGYEAISVCLNGAFLSLSSLLHLQR